MLTAFYILFSLQALRSGTTYVPENLTTHAALQDFKKRYLSHVTNLY